MSVYVLYNVAKEIEMLKELKLPCDCTYGEQCSHCYEYESKIKIAVDGVV